MKKMNKVTAALLAAAMVVPMAMPAFALTQADTEGTTTVNYTRTATYTWTIPAEVTVEVASQRGEATDKITVSNNVIENGKALKIKVATNNTFTLTNTGAGSDTRTFEVFKKSNETTKVATGGVLLEVPAGTDSGDETLVVKLVARTSGESDKTGTYTGTLTYEAAVEDPTT